MFSNNFSERRVMLSHSYLYLCVFSTLDCKLCSVPWASYQIRKIAGCACAGNAGNVSPHRRLQRKLLVSDPGMHHGTCVTHVPWCMSGSLTCSGGENVPGIPGACAPAILCIWQEAHWHIIIWHKWLNDQIQHQLIYVTIVFGTLYTEFMRLHMAISSL